MKGIPLWIRAPMGWAMLAMAIARLPAATIETRTIDGPNGNDHRTTYYFVKKAGKVEIKDYDLLIFLHGAGDTAANFAKFLSSSVDSRPNLIIAVPESDVAYQEGYTWQMNPSLLINAIINETVAHDSVNPKHVMLAGLSAGGYAADAAMASRPGQIACFGLMAADFPIALMSPVLRSYAKRIPVYFAVGTTDPNHAYFAESVKVFKDAGFKIQTEEPKIGHGIILGEVENMLNYFTGTLKQQDQGSATQTLVNGATVEDRLNYFYVRHASPNTASTQVTDLLVFLPGGGFSAADFAKSKTFTDLVGKYRNLAVAFPIMPQVTAGPHNESAIWQIATIIEQETKRTGINRHHVMLAGYADGGKSAYALLNQDSALFSCFGAIGTDLPQALPQYLVQKPPVDKIAVYYTVGSQDKDNQPYFDATRRQLRDQGFNVLAEQPVANHTITAEEIDHMMAFFDEALIKMSPMRMQASIPTEK